MHLSNNRKWGLLVVQLCIELKKLIVTLKTLEIMKLKKNIDTDEIKKRDLIITICKSDFNITQDEKPRFKSYNHE